MKLSKNNSCPVKDLQNTDNKESDDYSDTDTDNDDNDDNEDQENDYNDDNDDNDGNNNEISKRKKRRIRLKHAKSVKFDPTTQVKHPFPDLIWKMTFHRLPEAPELQAATLSSNQVMDLFHCCLLSNEVYKPKNKRHLPPNLSNIVLECTTSDYYRIPYFVVDSHELDTIFVAFRGSSCMKDWHVDFLAAAIQFANGFVHEGVLFTTLNIFNDIKHQIHLLSITHNKRKIIMTGHSLGGAVAAMISILFNEGMADLNVRAVCLAPVASLSKEIWESSHKYIQSYINYGDLVPFISYYNTYYLPENSLPKLTHDHLVRWCVKKINKHSKRPEFKSLVESFTKPVEIPYKLIPPGNSYIIRIVDQKAAKVDIQTVSDQFSYFGQFLKNLSSTKHGIRFYKHSIIRYLCQFYNQDEKLINYYSLKKKNHKKHHRRNHHKINNGNESDSDYDDIQFGANASAPSFYSSSKASFNSSNLQSQTTSNDSIIAPSDTTKA